jgi:exodeoxyribonuclease V gamma subunit
MEEKAAFSGMVEFFVVKSLLEKNLKETKRSYGYMTGGITFCSLLPMRSIPHRVVCIIGMNNAEYPRHSEEGPFDLIGRAPRQGDPSPVDEDRYLFLEALLSARQTFYISYLGLSSDDNSPIPPSVVVSELLDYLAEGFSAAEGTLREQLLIYHRLQAFHPSYFHPDKKLFSYCMHNCKAAKRLGEPDRVKRTFFRDPLPDEGDVSREISIADLKSFFGNPSKYLLKKRIGLSLERDHEIPSDSEAFRIDGLAGFEIGEEMLKHALSGQDGKEFFDLMMASGKLPHGAAGLASHQTLWSEISAFAALLNRESGGKTMSPVDLDLSVGGFHIAGRMPDSSETGILRYRFARIRAKDHLGIWIDLLLLGAAGMGAVEAPSFIVGRDERWKYLPPQNVSETLLGLLELYALGMRNPLFFFPETSLCYVEHLIKGLGEKEALRQAEKKWRGDSYTNRVNGEADDPYFRQCFSDEPDFDEDFRKTAAAVFSPLLFNRDKYR